jgi:hypothetical protein
MTDKAYERATDLRKSIKVTEKAIKSLSMEFGSNKTYLQNIQIFDRQFGGLIDLERSIGNKELIDEIRHILLKQAADFKKELEAL